MFPPPVVVVKRVLGDGNNEKRRKWFSGVKTHLFKLKTSKTGAVLSCGEAGKGLQGKILGDGINEKRRKWFSPFLIFNFNK